MFTLLLSSLSSCPSVTALTPILLLALPLGSLIITLVLITLYLRREEKKLFQAMRAPLLAVDVEQGG
jgi:cytochrome c-type biogenesis protein CcmH/NrfF